MCVQEWGGGTACIQRCTLVAGSLKRRGTGVGEGSLSTVLCQASGPSRRPLLTCAWEESVQPAHRTHAHAHTHAETHMTAFMRPHTVGTSRAP